MRLGMVLREGYEALLAQFETFDRQNPKVWELFRKFTLDRIEKGFKTYSSDAICHRIRWESSIATTDKNSVFKLNDHYTAFYGRKFMDEYPEHKGFFRTRVQKSRTS